MAIHQRLKNWFRQKSRSRKNGQEETVAVPEVHCGTKRRTEPRRQTVLSIMTM